MTNGRNEITPARRKWLLSLSQSARVEVRRLLASDLPATRRDTKTEQLESLRAFACHRLGVDVTVRSRISSVLDARSAFILVARELGFSQSEIARFLGLNHATVCLTERSRREALEVPAFYQNFISNYNILQQWEHSNN